MFVFHCPLKKIPHNDKNADSIGLAGSTRAWDQRGSGFNPRYRQIHCGLDDHLKWQSYVIGSYPQWQVKEFHGH